MLSKARSVRKLLLIMLVAGAAIIPIGCGSGGDGSSGDASSTQQSSQSQASPGEGDASSQIEVPDGLTRAALIAKADKICEATDKAQKRELQAYLKDHPNGTSTSKGEVDMVREAGLPPIREEVEKLLSLGAPPGEEEEVAAIYDGIESALEEGEQNPRSLLSETGNPFIEVGKQAAKYGFAACSNPL
jgi:hypothetical protein